MSELERELFEQRLMSIANRLDYPRTPDIATAVMARIRPSARPRFISRRLAWSLAIMLVLFSSLMLIPPARAAIIEFIQIGIVRIFPRPTEPPIDTIGTATPGAITPMTATASIPSATFIPSLSRIAGETTFADAQQRVSYSILVPTYPPDLGQPDHVFVQDNDGEMSILVWLDPRQPEQVLMSLHLVPQGSWAIEKAEPQVIEETTVNGRRAIWATGPYPLRLHNGDLDFTRLIDGHVLIWADGDITYRLETGLPLEEAIKIAESLQPIP
ncbi:MAG TPA: hypothetical protein VNA23_01730 [Anaerolineales bacterium]|nr:hypothetical protein [Anaerolineales bacterium]